MTGDRRHITRSIAAFALITLAGCSSTATAPAPAADNSAERAALAAYFTADFTCTRAAAEGVGLKLLHVAADRYLEKCIRLDAFTDGTFLYVNANGMKPIKDAPAGLVWKNDDTAKHLKLGPSFVTITGRLRDCAKHNAMTQQANALNVAATPAAACKSSATAIFISEAQVVPTAMD